MSNQPIELTPQDETARRIAACVSAFEGIPTYRIEGKNLGEILAGEVRLNGAGPRADGGFGFEFSGGVCQLMAEAYAEQFRQSGAINYLELLFHHSDIGPLTITMQRVEGLTPAQKLAQAEAQRDAMAAENAALARYFSASAGAVAHWNSWADSEDKLSCTPETPATAAYLNSVRAEGVEMYGKATIAIGEEEGDEAIAYAGKQALLYAAQLRAGEDGE